MPAKRRALLLLDSSGNQHNAHPLFFSRLNLEFELRVLYLNFTELKPHDVIRTASLMFARQITQFILPSTSAVILIGCPRWYSMLQTRFAVESHLLTAGGNTVIFSNACGKILFEKDKVFAFHFFHMKYCSTGNYPHINTFVSDIVALEQQQIDLTGFVSTIIHNMDVASVVKAPLLENSGKDFYTLFVVIKPQEQKYRVYGRSETGERVVVEHKITSEMDRYFVTSNSHPSMDTTSTLSNNLPEIRALNHSANVYAIGMSAPKIALSNAASDLPSFSYPKTGFAFKYNPSGKPNRHAHSYVDLDNINNNVHYQCRFWNALGLLPEIMIQNKLLCGYGKKREIMPLKLLKVEYLVFCNGNYKLGSSLYSTSRLVLEALCKLQPDILVCLGIMSAMEYGYFNQDVFDYAPPMRIIHLEAHEINRKHIINQPQIMRECTNLDQLQARAKQVDTEFCVSQLAFVSASYVGICSLSEKLSNPEQLMRIMGRKLRCEYQYVSFPPFISKGNKKKHQLPMELEDYDKESEEEETNESRGGQLFLKIVNPKELLDDVYVVDFSSYYPTICAVSVKTDDDTFGLMMRELMSQRRRYKDAKDCEEDAPVLEKGYKDIANTLTGSRWHLFPDQAESMTQMGRTILRDARRFIEEELGLRVVYGHTDSLFVESFGMYEKKHNNKKNTHSTKKFYS